MVDLLWRVGLRVAIRVLRVVWFFQRPESHGAYVAVWWDDRLLLVRNSYRRGEVVPCGEIHRGETAVDAARRELEEEAGIRADESDLRFACEVVVPFEFKLDHAHFFELHVAEEPRVRVDNREVVWAGFVAEAELADRPLMTHVEAYLAERAASVDGTPAGDD